MIPLSKKWGKITWNIWESRVNKIKLICKKWDKITRYIWEPNSNSNPNRNSAKARQNSGAMREVRSKFDRDLSFWGATMAIEGIGVGGIDRRGM